MTVAEHYRTNLRIAIPVMMGQLGHIMVSVADSVMVGQLGTIPLAAVAFGNSIYVILMVFGLGITYGITPLVAQSIGKKQYNLQSALLRHSLRVNAGSALILFLLLIGCLPLMPYMGQEEGVIEMAGPYLIITGSSIIPLMIFQAFKQFAEGFSDTKRAMQIIIGCNLLNVALNYVLIYGKFGFPALGINGAAWATLIARSLMVVFIARYILNHQRFRKHQLSLFGFRLRKKIIRKLLQVGVPMGLQFTFEVTAFALAAIFAGMINATALAAHQIAINIASVSYMGVTGLGAAATVRVGNQVGEKDVSNLRKASKSIFIMAAAWMAFAGVIIFFMRGILAGFYSSDVEVLALATKLLIVAVLFQLSDGIQAVALGALRGFTDVKIPTWIVFIVYWLLVLPIAYATVKFTSWGAMGIWYTLAAGLTLSAVLLTGRYAILQKRFAAKLKF